MTNERENLNRASKKKFSKAKKVVVGIINPISDLKIIYGSGFKPLLEKFRQLIRISNEGSNSSQELTFDQAVSRSGKTVEQLIKRYQMRYFFWTLSMLSLTVLSLFLLFLIFTASNLSPITMARATVTALFMFVLGFYSYTQTLVAVYRHWQLRNKRVSISERGTFADFCQEVRPIYSIITCKYQTRLWR